MAAHIKDGIVYEGGSPVIKITKAELDVLIAEGTYDKAALYKIIDEDNPVSESGIIVKSVDMYEKNENGAICKSNSSTPSSINLYSVTPGLMGSSNTSRLTSSELAVLGKGGTSTIVDNSGIKVDAMIGMGGVVNYDTGLTREGLKLGGNTIAGIDSTPTKDSTNLVTSGGVENSISAINSKLSLKKATLNTSTYVTNFGDFEMYYNEIDTVKSHGYIVVDTNIPTWRTVFTTNITLNNDTNALFIDAFSGAAFPTMFNKNGAMASAAKAIPAGSYFVYVD